jgi:hypothetical protein
MDKKEKREIENIIDIAKLNKWGEVKRAIRYFYPEDKNNYKDLFLKIKEWKPVELKNPDEVLTLYVSGRDTNWTSKDEFYGISTNQYSLSFRDWIEVASIPIEDKTLENHLTRDILAHFIWEITYYGDEKEMKKTAKRINSKIEKIKLNKK